MFQHMEFVPFWFAKCQIDRIEQPIGYASHTLTDAERNYSQLEKEVLHGMHLWCETLPCLPVCHHFELVTDHQPLLALMSEHRSTSPQASAQMQRWALFLYMYKYILRFRKTEAHCNAKALSHLPLPTALKEVPVPPELVLLKQHLQQLPVTADHAHPNVDPERPCCCQSVTICLVWLAELRGSRTCTLCFKENGTVCS